MTCFFCGGEMINSTDHLITSSADNVSLIVLKNIPCNRCTQCGEILFSHQSTLNQEAIFACLTHQVTEDSFFEYEVEVEKLARLDASDLTLNFAELANQ